MDTGHRYINTTPQHTTTKNINFNKTRTKDTNGNQVGVTLDNKEINPKPEIIPRIEELEPVIKIFGNKRIKGRKLSLDL